VRSDPDIDDNCAEDAQAPVTAELRISILVCTHNRPETLALLLDALKPQLAAAPAEVIVVDSASRPEAAERVRDLVRQVAGARLIRVDEPGVSRARNIGLQQVRAPWIAVLDDDEVPTPTWLASALSLIRRLPEDCAVCGGNVRPIYPKGSNPKVGPRWSAYLSTILRRGEFDQTDDLRLGMGHSIGRTRAFRETGGFDSRLGRRAGNLLSGEDVLLALQLIDAGWRIWHSDRLEVGHIIEPERLTKHWVLKRAYWEGVTTARMLRIQDRRTLHAEAARIAIKAGPLGIAAILAPSFRELRLRFAFVAGFLASYAGALSGLPRV
jgi:glycosyltransferase involved in cell wall biosynthesis